MVESFLEALHFGLRADGNAYMRGPNGPLAADKNILRSHRGDDFLRGALRVEHEAIGLRWHERIAVLREPLKRSFADRRIDVLAIGNEARILQARCSGGHGGDGHGAPAGEGSHFFEKVWPADGKAATQAGHAVDL